MNCLQIIPDEVDANILQEYFSRLTCFSRIEKVSNSIEAYSFLLKEKVPLIIMDLDEKNGIDGCEFVRSLNYKPAVIFVSTEKSRAVDAFDIGATDFILKPVTFDRFFKAVNRAVNCIDCPRIAAPIQAAADRDSGIKDDLLFLKADNKIVKVNTNDILYISAQSDYVKIFLRDERPLLFLNSLKKIEGRLPSSRFVRVHRSYIVALDKINSIERKRIRIGDAVIPVSDSYYNSFLKIIDEPQ